MRALIRAIDKFCLTHRRFGIPKLMMYLVFGYAAVYLISTMDASGTFAGLIAFKPELIIRGEIWRLVSWVFYAPDSGFLSMSGLFFTALMLYFYYFIGSTLEREWGTPKFNVYYLIGILLNVIYGFIAWLIFGGAPMLDTSYLNLSMFFAFAVFYPEQRVMVFFVIPVKIKWLALFDAGIFVFSIISSVVLGLYAYALLPVIAIFNFFIFCGEDLMRYLRPYRIRTSKQTINFKKAAKQKKQQDAAHPYRHKCSVCGKTDLDHPNLEFRYCSRCNGYHCFCTEHINNHVHFQ